MNISVLSLTLLWPSHWKWYEWVKLDESFHRAKTDIYHISNFGENCNVNVFFCHASLDGPMCGRPARWPGTDHYISLFFSCEAKISTTKTSCFVETEQSQTEHWLQYSETYARKFWTTIFLSVNLRFVFFFPQKKIIASDPSVFLLWSYRKKETDCKSELTTDEFSEEGDSIVQFGPTRIHH